MSYRLTFSLSFITIFCFVACSPTATETPISSTATSAPPTQTLVPLPSNTPFLATASSLPPTETPVLTSTKIPTSTAEPISMPAFEPSLCRFQHGSPFKVECGDLIVPENRHKLDSAAIRIHVAIFKSTSPNSKPDPVIYVTGGGGVDQLSTTDQYLSGIGAEILKERDFIMYNQRGADLNKPSLVCPDLTNFYWSLAAQDLTPHEKADLRIEKRLECHNALLANGIDLSGYNTVETAADISDLRKVLGYDQWNLYGTSSGTRTILTVLRNHPNGIRSVILLFSLSTSGRPL